MERQPNKQEQRFASPRDEMLFTLSTEGWANEHSGHTASPTGLFARLSNPPEEMIGLVDAFEDVFTDAHFTDTGSLQGHFLVTEAVDRVQVEEYETAEELEREYAKREFEFRKWSQEQES